MGSSVTEVFNMPPHLLVKEDLSAQLVSTAQVVLLDLKIVELVITTLTKEDLTVTTVQLEDFAKVQMTLTLLFALQVTTAQLKPTLLTMRPPTAQLATMVHLKEWELPMSALSAQLVNIAMDSVPTPRPTCTIQTTNLTQDSSTQLDSPLTPLAWRTCTPWDL
jgi:hypothetical protein